MKFVKILDIGDVVLTETEKLGVVKHRRLHKGTSTFSPEKIEYIVYYQDKTSESFFLEQLSIPTKYQK